MQINKNNLSAMYIATGSVKSKIERLDEQVRSAMLIADETDLSAEQVAMLYNHVLQTMLAAVEHFKSEVEKDLQKSAAQRRSSAAQRHRNPPGRADDACAVP